MANALIRPHPLSDRGQIELVMPSGSNLQDIADAVWAQDAQTCVVLTINGDIIPSKYWKQVRPKDGAMVRGTLTFAGGGGGGKKILALVAIIAIAVFAPYAAIAMGFTTTAGALTGLGYAVAAGISMVGNMLVNSLFKPAGVSAGSSGSSTDPKESQTYSITSQSNQSTPYAAIPRVYGKHRLFPRLAATPFVVSESGEQYLYMLLDFGFGPLSLSDLEIGDTPLLNYQEVSYRIHKEFVAGDRLSIYTSDVYVETIGSELQYNQPVIRVSAPESIKLGVDLAFPRGLVTYNDAGNRTPRSVSFDIQLRLEGSPTWIGAP